MANKKNWFESIENRVPSTEFEFELPTFKRGESLADALFKTPFDLENVNLHVTPFDEFMDSFKDFGFKDMDDHYEMVTNLGGSMGESGVPENAVRVRLAGKDNRTVEVTYEHSASSDENNFYSHSQRTSVTLPDDADEKTVRAYFDDDDNVVVSVMKEVKEDKPKVRNIPITRGDLD